MYAAIVFLPLLGFLIAGPFGWRIGDRSSEFVTTGLLFVSGLFSWVVFFQVALGTAPASVSVLGNWFTSGALQVDWSLKIDSLTAVMLVVVGQEGQDGVLVLHLAVEHRLVPGDHLVELARAIDDMHEAGRTDAGHDGARGL